LPTIESPELMEDVVSCVGAECAAAERFISGAGDVS
jgi:hypothetical protein